MKKIIILSLSILLFLSCKDGKDSFVKTRSIGKTNKVLIVTKNSYWEGNVGKEIRNSLGQHVIGLPQPETLMSASQVAPKGFQKMMQPHRNILIIQKGKEDKFVVSKDVYAAPQTVIYVTGKDDEGMVENLKKHAKDIIETFKKAELKVIENRFKKNKTELKLKTITNLNIDITIPDSFRLVEDTGDFLWLRQHLRSGIARGDGSSNILMYSIPLEEENTVANAIVSVRDTIGKKHIPGSKEGRYMITEAAFTPFTIESSIDDKKAFETRGKWEVKNDFMAGPFLNYSIIDKENNRVVVFEGFTYAPSVNKREFIFELETIAKSIKFLK